MQLAWKLGVVALVALALALLPGGGAALDVLLTLLTVAFFAAIAFLGYRVFRQYRFEIETLPDGQRLLLYGSVGLALLAFTATNRLLDEGGLGFLAWLGLLALASLGLYRVWVGYRDLG